jgi:hypothetical protein
MVVLSPTRAVILTVPVTSLGFLALLGAIGARAGGADVPRATTPCDILGCACDGPHRRHREIVWHRGLTGKSMARSPAPQWRVLRWLRSGSQYFASTFGSYCQCRGYVCIWKMLTLLALHSISAGCGTLRREANGRLRITPDHGYWVRLTRTTAGLLLTPILLVATRGSPSVARSYLDWLEADVEREEAVVEHRLPVLLWSKEPIGRVGIFSCLK